MVSEPMLRLTSACRRRFAVCLLVLAGGLASSLAVSAATDDESVRQAEDVVAGLHRALAAVAAMEPPPSLDERIRLLAPTVIAAHDLARMARLTVSRPSWRSFSEAEREAYIETFERYTVTSYASRFAGISPDAFEIVDSEAIGDGQVDVHAVIHTKGELGDVPMDYSLAFDGTQFRIVNILADGVSDLMLMRAEHFEILQHGGPEDLIADLEAKIAAL